VDDDHTGVVPDGYPAAARVVVTLLGRSRLLGFLTLLIVALGLPDQAAANMANPVQPGDLVGEPSAALQSIAIVQERLNLDLRPLLTDQPVHIAATYQVQNGGTATTLPLEFVATGLTTGATTVQLDGQPITALALAAPPLPASWQAPATTPAIGAGPPLHYQARRDGVLTFQLRLLPGPHTITVGYPARASAYSDDRPTRYWQLGYVLAPARQWASFGQLDVTVELPSGWSSASQPPLRACHGITVSRLGGTTRGDARCNCDGYSVTGPLVPLPQLR
jgi:hypothetical protein